MRNSRQILKDLFISLVLLAVYYIAGRLGLKLAFVNASATAVWPPTGIALAALLILGYRFWPVILLGAFLVNINTSGFILSSIGIAIGNTLEAVVGAYLVNKLASALRVFKRTQDVFKFVLFAGVIATAISASIGVGSLIVDHLATLGNAPAIWLT